MAKNTVVQIIKKNKKNNKGIHSKKKSSKNKNSTNYIKPYNRQGR